MKLQLTFLLLGLLLITSCLKTETNTKSSTTDDGTTSLITTPTATPTPTSSATATPTTRSPYPMGAFTVHGDSGHSIVWSSQTDGIPSSIMVTDSRFDIRIKKYDGPPRETVDKFDSQCMYVTFPYTKLKGSVRIRVNGSTIYKEKDFETGSNGYSEILRFGDLADFPITSDYYIIEVVEPIQSDGGCVRNPGHPDVCPYWPVPFTECYKMEIELATDYTDPF